MRNSPSWSRGRSGHAVLASGIAVFLSAMGTGSAPGTLRLVPEVYPSIRDAVNHAAEGDTILLSPGVYSGYANINIDPGTLNLVFTSREGPDRTIIDCAGAGQAFNFHALGIDRSTRVERLTIMNGYLSPGLGGAILCETTSPTITECRFYNNHASDGGAISLALSGAIVNNCIFAGNRADGSGGAIDVQFGGAVIGNCVFSGNSASNYGGGVNLHDSGTYTMWGCTITGNKTEYDGGGVYASEPTTLTRCILWGNCAAHAGNELGADHGEDVSFRCCDVDSTGLFALWGTFHFFDRCVFTDPSFCGPVPCSQTTEGDWTLNGESPCLPENSPCGELIGALEQGCGSAPTTGACCLPDRRCVISTRSQCEGQSGTFMGNGIACLPNPCLPTSGLPAGGEASTWGRVKARFH